MATTSTQWLHLAPNPKSWYRQLFIKGTRILSNIFGAQITAQNRDQIMEMLRLSTYRPFRQLFLCCLRVAANNGVCQIQHLSPRDPLTEIWHAMEQVGYKGEI